MKIKIKDKDSGFRLNLVLPTRATLWVLKKAVKGDYPWLIPLLVEAKKSKNLMKGRPLVEIDSDEAYVRITL